MSDNYTGLAALVTAIATLVGAITAFLVVLRKLTDIKHTVNSLSDKRVEEARASGDAQGRLGEKDAQQMRRDIRESVAGGMPQSVIVKNPITEPVPITTTPEQQ